MITLIVIIAVVWTTIRIVQFLGYPWRLADATVSSQAAVAA